MKDGAQVKLDILWIMDWMSCLANAAENTFGYNGLRRNVYRVAESTPKPVVEKYPFATPAEFKCWLSELTEKAAAPKIKRNKKA